jgi:hypothetical protein
VFFANEFCVVHHGIFMISNLQDPPTVHDSTAKTKRIRIISVFLDI